MQVNDLKREFQVCQNRNDNALGQLEFFILSFLLVCHQYSEIFLFLGWIQMDVFHLTAYCEFFFIVDKTHTELRDRIKLRRCDSYE